MAGQSSLGKHVYWAQSESQRKPYHFPHDILHLTEMGVARGVDLHREEDGEVDTRAVTKSGSAMMNWEMTLPKKWRQKSGMRGKWLNMNISVKVSHSLPKCYVVKLAKRIYKSKKKRTSVVNIIFECVPSNYEKCFQESGSAKLKYLAHSFQKQSERVDHKPWYIL